ncbi:hypothetical protein [Runella limosa]|uniref:hypothetical protein n=1 Tax=Runella limosa TaxID=370978 RepID=UPI000421A635|nr:hypothetical protein [Runella limosa]
MKRIFFLFALLFNMGAWAQSKADVETSIDTTIVENGAGKITPSLLRFVLRKIVDYSANKSPNLHTHTTSDLSDWTTAWAARFANQTTSALAEGSNLYYSDSRVQTFSDGRYGRLGSSNSWTGINTFNGLVKQNATINVFQQISPNLSTFKVETADGYTTFGTSSNTPLAFVQNNTEVFRVTGNNLLIGTTTNSAYKLDVNGISRFQSSLAINGTLFLKNAQYINAENAGGSSTRILGINSNNDMYIGGIDATLSNMIFVSSSTERARFFPSGNFGLKTTTDAGYTCDINGTTRISGDLTVTTNISPAIDGGGELGGGGRSFGGARIGTVLTQVIKERYAGSHIGFRLNNDVEAFRLFATNGNAHFQNGGTYTDISSARVAINSTTQGFLPPRMTTTQRNAISSPVAGLIIYCTDCTATDASTGVSQTYNGSTWKNHY